MEHTTNIGNLNAKKAEISGMHVYAKSIDEFK